VKDISEEVSKMITSAANKQMKDSPYRVFTKDYDKVEIFKPKTNNFELVTKIEDQVKQMISVMQKDIERMIAAKTVSMRIPGFRSGKLHSGNLHRLMANDDRIFRRKQEFKSKETAVSLVIDLSGSMNGGGYRGNAKYQIALKAAYALASTFDRIGVKFECSGFTTFVDHELHEKIRKEVGLTRINYTRWEALYIPIFKTFDEKFTPNVKLRIAESANHFSELHNNVDGECVEVAALRLLKRPEPRKIMMVFSDGNPACSTGDSAALRFHLKSTVQKIEKSNVEVIGVGIMDDSVKSFYKNYTVIHKVEDLPSIAMKEFKKILLK
jgi:cobalamin biosynthesis protein CobT